MLSDIAVAPMTHVQLQTYDEMKRRAPPSTHNPPARSAGAPAKPNHTTIHPSSSLILNRRFILQVKTSRASAQNDAQRRTRQRMREVGLQELDECTFHAVAQQVRLVRRHVLAQSLDACLQFAVLSLKLTTFEVTVCQQAESHTHSQIVPLIDDRQPGSHHAAPLGRLDRHAGRHKQTNESRVRAGRHPPGRGSGLTPTRLSVTNPIPVTSRLA